MGLDIGGSLQFEDRSVAGATSELKPVPRFPAEASGSGVVRQLGGMDRGRGPLVVVNDELAWVDENGRFDVFGLELGNSYSLNVFGNSIANRSGKLSDYEEKLATVIYAPVSMFRSPGYARRWRFGAGRAIGTNGPAVNGTTTDTQRM